MEYMYVQISLASQPLHVPILIQVHELVKELECMNTNVHVNTTLDAFVPAFTSGRVRVSRFNLDPGGRCARFPSVIIGKQQEHFRVIKTQSRYPEETIKMCMKQTCPTCCKLPFH